MKIKLFLLSLFIFNYVYSSTIVSKWEKVCEDNNIQIYERWIIVNDNIKLKERTGKFTLNCTSIDVINLIRDVNRSHLWMKSIESIYIIKRISEDEWYEYTLLKVPWPFGNQDMVSKYVIKRDLNNNIHIIISNEDNLISVKKNIDRLDTFNAEWIIKEINDKVEITFTTTSTEPSKYPSKIQDPIVRKVFLNNLINFKNLLNKV